MSLELWSTVASIGTFVVIAATAAAALMQLRHMRSSNQIVAITEVRETLESEQFQRARHFAAEEVPKLIADPAGIKKLMARPLPMDLEPLRLLANFFETMGAFVKAGVIDQTLACDLWGGVIIDAWKSLEPAIAIRRLVVHPGVWENFEYLTVLPEDYIARHPHGSYPPSVRRIKFEESALAATAAAQDQASARE